MAHRRTRRSVLAAMATASVGFAGCTGSPTDPDDGGPTDTPATGTPGQRLPVAGRWPQRGFDAGHGGVADRAGVPDDGRVYWHRRRIRSGPAVLADGRLYHYAELGANPNGTPTPTRTPPTPGTAHHVAGTPHLVAREAETGELAWWTGLANRGGGWPAVGDDSVVATAPGEVLAVDPASGARRWRDSLGAVATDDGEFPRPVGDPTVAGDAVVVPLGGVVDGSGECLVTPAVRAYGPDGTERWTVDAPKRGLGVAAGADAVAVLAWDYEGPGAVQGRSLSDGSVRWRETVEGARFNPPAVAGEAVYVAGSDGTVTALSLADGRERWTRETERRPPALAAGEDAVYAAAGDLLKLAATDGTVRWRATDAAYTAPPAVGGDTVYAGGVGRKARFRALAADDGTERWSHPLPETVVEGDMVMAGVRSRPTVGDGGVFVDAVDGLYAFGPGGQ